MIYSTGDSLGGDLDKRCEIIGATYDVYLAYKIKHYIGGDCKDNQQEDFNYEINSFHMYDVCGIKFYTFGKAILGKAILKA
jgi:hypothetical protein